VKNQRLFVLLLAMAATLFFCSILYGQSAATDAPSTGEATTIAVNPPDAILLTSIPVKYGETNFLRRIEERTGGTRDAVGLVLSGGSARAFAHIGVLQYLEDQGIVPDFIISNSMGSIVGLLYAAGFSPTQIYEIISQTPISRLFRVGLPLQGGVLDVEKFIGYLYRFTGKLKLDELPIPIMVICEDIRTRRQIRIMEGDFLTVIQASFALPVFFNPVIYKEHSLIDGGVTNLVPLKIASEISNTIIASTTFYNNKKLDLKNPLTILSISMDISKTRKAVEELNDYKPILIRVAVEQFSFMSFDQMVRLSAVGYESAKQQLDAQQIQQLKQLVQSNIYEASLIQKRQDLPHTINSAIKHFGDASRIENIRPALNIFPELSFHGYPGEEAWLRDDIYMGLNMLTGWQGFEAGIGAGLNFNRTSGEIRAISSGFLHYFLGQFLSLSGSGILEFNNITPPETGYSALKIVTKLPPLARIQLSAGSILETRWVDRLHQIDQNLLTTWMLAQIDIALLKTQWEAGLQYNDFSLPQLFATNRLALDLAMNMNIHNYLLYKSNLSSGLPLPFFARDGLSLPFNASNEVLSGATSINIGFPRFRPSFAELLIVKNTRIAAYGEYQWQDKNFTNWGLGLELTATISLIGLSEVALTTNAIWDFSNARILWNIYLKNN